MRSGILNSVSLTLAVAFKSQNPQSGSYFRQTKKKKQTNYLTNKKTPRLFPDRRTELSKGSEKSHF